MGVTGIIGVLYLYIKKVILVAYVASEESAEIFTRIQTYGEHLSSVYQMPVFYGDETLKSLLDHTKEVVLFLQTYEDIYSFTQPDLIEQLEVSNLNETQEEE